MAVKSPDRFLQRAKEWKRFAREMAGIGRRTEWP
jgi:hypothetical protein